MSAAGGKPAFPANVWNKDSRNAKNGESEAGSAFSAGGGKTESCNRRPLSSTFPLPAPVARHIILRFLPHTFHFSAASFPFPSVCFSFSAAVLRVDSLYRRRVPAVSVHYGAISRRHVRRFPADTHFIITRIITRVYPFPQAAGICTSGEASFRFAYGRLCFMICG